MIQKLDRMELEGESSIASSFLMLIIGIIIVFGSGLEILEQREAMGAALGCGHWPTLSHVKRSSS